ncbi:MAG: GH3 auxin-responsive promoter family protein [Chloroflexi bacterium]|nr:GH3 auxin-responsive promoter family protein [Chloroflexota bacterium]
MDVSLGSAALAASQLWRWLADANRFEQTTRDLESTQHLRLMTILRRNRDTEYGRAYGFASTSSIAAYQRNVPINSYESLSPWIERMANGEQKMLTADAPQMFATTSGTTGKQKLIPVTPSSLAEYNHAVQVHTWRLLSDHPGAADGKFLVTSSSDVEGHTPAGIAYGAMSGYVIKNQPALIRRHFVLPYEVALVKDIELKYYLTLRLAVDAPVSAISTLNPSSIVLLCEKLQVHAERLIADVRAGTATALGTPLPPDLARALAPHLTPNPRRADELQSHLRASGELRPREIWPDLAVVACWKGGTMPLYFRQVKRWFPDLPTRDRGYMASEGCGSIPLVDAGAAGALAITSTFFEFVPVDEREQPNPPVYTAEALQPGRDYYVLLTNSAGLYRYDINDIVRVVDFYHDVPMIEFVRKGRGMTSLTGEKLAEQQVTAAMMTAVEALDLDAQVRHFAAVPHFANPPRYAVFLETSGALSDEQARALVARLDRALCDENVEYQTKRESQRLGPPLLRIVQSGTFDAYRQERVRGGAPEAQVKIPHLTPDRSFGSEFAVVREIEQVMS